MGCLGGYTPSRITAGKWQLRESGGGWKERREDREQARSYKKRGGEERGAAVSRCAFCFSG